MFRCGRSLGGVEGLARGLRMILRPIKQPFLVPAAAHASVLHPSFSCHLAHCSGTIMDNITFGSGASREQVLEAARAAQVGCSDDAHMLGWFC